MRQAYSQTVLDKALPLMTKANPSLLRSGTFYVAETEDGQIIACGGWTPDNPADGQIAHGKAHVRHFATHPNWLKRGYARAIFERCRHDAVAKGITEFECFASLNAEGFYAAMGFEPIEHVQVPMAPDVELPTVLMRRKL